LHQNDRVVAVLARDRRGEAEHVACLRRLRDGLEAHRRDVMALVDHDLAVIGHQIIDNAFPVQALNHGDIQAAGRPPFAAANDPDRLRAKLQKGA
jgi:hypothetical protein